MKLATFVKSRSVKFVNLSVIKIKTLESKLEELWNALTKRKVLENFVVIEINWHMRKETLSLVFHGCKFCHRQFLEILLFCVELYSGISKP